MFPLIGAAGSALSLLNTVLQSSSANGAAKAGGDLLSTLGKTLSGGDSEQTKAVAGSGQGAPALSSGTMAALLALQGQDGINKPGGLFAKIDTDGDGKISKGEFEKTLGQAGVDKQSANALFGRLDADGDDSISKAELARGRYGPANRANLLAQLKQLQSQLAAGAATTTSTTA